MFFIGVDLGTTNIKVVLYNERLTPEASCSCAVEYRRDGNLVEFDAEAYFENLASMIDQCCAKIFWVKPYPIAQIVLTGQAESLVVLGKDGKPLRNAISWLDMRSGEECETLKAAFDADTCYGITGQPEITPTYPVTKILWLRRHEPEVFAAADKYLLLKDYIQYQMCGTFMGDHSIYTFSHYFNIVDKTYWKEILDFCGIREDQLPPTVPSGTVAGTATAAFQQQSGVAAETKINVGTLDHFAGMIGTGNIHEGTVSESTGTVLALATLLEKPVFSPERVALHAGPFDGTYVLLPVCESGGSSLEWFKKACMPDVSYDELNKVLETRTQPGRAIFLPYITGTNAPEYSMTASGTFFGCRAEQDAYDLAQAVMEGVAHLLNRNIVAVERAGLPVRQIISTGGGARSALWCQMKADLTGKTVYVPKDKEAACLGAALMGAVSEGLFRNYDEAAAVCVSMEQEYHPDPNKKEAYAKKAALYDTLYEALQPAFRMQPAIGEGEASV